MTHKQRARRHVRAKTGKNPKHRPTRLAKDQPLPVYKMPEPKWGVADERRGLGHKEIAAKFIQAHPIGSVLSREKFDQWLHDNELLQLPPVEASKNSDAWMGHLQRRHIMRNRINTAGTTPRMTEMGLAPFVIASNGQAGYEVRAPHVEAQRGQLARAIESLTKTKKKQLTYLLQSSDFASLPPFERLVADQLYKEIETFTQTTMTHCSSLHGSLDTFINNVRGLVSSGALKPTPGAGIDKMLAGRTEPEAEEVE